jgi:hypothetical protein
MDHSPIMPLWRGAPFVCLNATTGALIWRIDGAFRQTFWGGRAIIGDSIIATQDTYDQQIYAIGKGPSKTTVTAPDISSTEGTSITIKGTVMDVSPGTASDASTLRFPNGVPAVSDESQSDWMLYVYKQLAKPTNTTGVQVDLTAVDSKMNTINIGTTWTDTQGNFGFSWAPKTAGTYQIVATFKGTSSYYGSTATTYATVTAAPEAPPPEPEITIPDYTLAIVGVGIAMILAVAIVGALVLRKRA